MVPWVPQGGFSYSACQTAPAATSPSLGQAGISGDSVAEETQWTSREPLRTSFWSGASVGHLFPEFQTGHGAQTLQLPSLSLAKPSTLTTSALSQRNQNVHSFSSPSPWLFVFSPKDPFWQQEKSFYSSCLKDASPTFASMSHLRWPLPVFPKALMANRLQNEI